MNSLVHSCAIAHLLICLQPTNYQGKESAIILRRKKKWNESSESLHPGSFQQTCRSSNPILPSIRYQGITRPTQRFWKWLRVGLGSKFPGMGSTISGCRIRRNKALPRATFKMKSGLTCTQDFKLRFRTLANLSNHTGGQVTRRFPKTDKLIFAGHWIRF